MIVVDNGSKDETCKIAQRYNAEIILFPEGKTIASVRNHGALSAKGDILAFLDADCVVTEDWLFNAVKKLDASIGAVGSRPVAPLQSSTWVQRCWGKIMPRSLEGSNFVDWLSASNMILKRELFDKVDGFDEQLQTCEDVDIGFRLNKVTKILYAPDVKAFHLREPRTLFDLFKKEIWHGKSLFKSVFRHASLFRRLRIIGVPLFCLINMFFIIIGLVLRIDIWFISTIMFFSVPIIMTIRNLRRVKNPLMLCQCFLINTTYILGRSVSIICSFFSSMFNKLGGIGAI